MEESLHTRRLGSYQYLDQGRDGNCASHEPGGTMAAQPHHRVGGAPQLRVIFDPVGLVP